MSQFFEVRDKVETRTVVVGTEIVPNLALAASIGGMLYISNNEAECNHCSDDDFEFGNVQPMRDVMSRAFTHFAKHHPDVFKKNFE